MPRFKHWTQISARGDGRYFEAWCTGCVWTAETVTRPDAIVACKRHQQEAEAANAAYSPKVAELISVAITAPGEAEARAALAQARELHANERQVAA